MNQEEFNKFKISNPIKVTGGAGGTIIGSRRVYGGLGDLQTFVDVDYGTHVDCDQSYLVTGYNDGFNSGGDSLIGDPYP